MHYLMNAAAVHCTYTSYMSVCLNLSSGGWLRSTRVIPQCCGNVGPWKEMSKTILCRHLHVGRAHMSALKASSCVGISWPASATIDGKLKTTATNKAMWNACIEGMAKFGNVDKKECASLISAISKEADWRHMYDVHLHRMALLMVESTESAMAQATTGISKIHSEFKFERNNKSYTILDAVSGKATLALHGVETVSISGGPQAPLNDNEIKVPIKINNKYQLLQGDSLVKQARAWAEYGSCEPCVVTSIDTVASLNRADLPLKNRVFCMLGGTSECCPSRPLLALGATVAAVARPGAKLDALIAYAKTTAGTLLAPQLEGKDAPGLDLITHTPEVVSWLKSIAGENKLCVGSYVYLDGAKHVVASIAMDAICATLAEQLGAERVELAQLTSPMTSHIYPPLAMQNSKERWQNRPWYAELVGLEENAGSRVGIPSKSDRRVFRGTLIPQGPNYALAKTLQLWRCVLARANGQVVSANFAPPARTNSVLGGKLMPSVINGMQAFPPLIVCDVPTARSFMTALLLSDLMPTETRINNGNPADPSLKIDHPWEMFNYNAFTGGNWRLPYHQESTYNIAYLLGLAKYETGTVAVLNPDK